MFSDSCTSVLEERSLQYFRNYTTRGGRNCLRRDEHCATVCPLDEQDNNNLWIKLPGRDGPRECMLARKREAERRGIWIVMKKLSHLILEEQFNGAS